MERFKQNAEKALNWVKNGHISTVIAGTLAFGLLASASIFAANTTASDVAAIIQPKNSTKSSDFRVRAKIKPKSGRQSVNTQIFIDGHLVASKVSAKKAKARFSGKQNITYGFSAGFTRSKGKVVRNVFDRQVLKPGKHSVAVVMRSGTGAGKGKVLKVDKKNFIVKNSAIATSQGPTLTVSPLKPGQVIKAAANGKTQVTETAPSNAVAQADSPPGSLVRAAQAQTAQDPEGVELTEEDLPDDADLTPQNLSEEGTDEQTIANEEGSLTTPVDPSAQNKVVIKDTVTTEVDEVLEGLIEPPADDDKSEIDESELIARSNLLVPFIRVAEAHGGSNHISIRVQVIGPDFFPVPATVKISTIDRHKNRGCGNNGVSNHFRDVRRGKTDVNKAVIFSKCTQDRYRVSVAAAPSAFVKPKSIVCKFDSSHNSMTIRLGRKGSSLPEAHCDNSAASPLTNQISGGKAKGGTITLYGRIAEGKGKFTPVSGAPLTVSGPKPCSGSAKTKKGKGPQFIKKCKPGTYTVKGAPFKRGNQTCKSIRGVDRFKLASGQVTDRYTDYKCVKTKPSGSTQVSTGGGAGGGGSSGGGGSGSTKPAKVKGKKVKPGTPPKRNNRPLVGVYKITTETAGKPAVATVDAFSLAASGRTTKGTIKSIRSEVDGKVIETKTITNNAKRPTVRGEAISLGTIGNGQGHTIKITAVTTSGQSGTARIKVAAPQTPESQAAVTQEAAAAQEVPAAVAPTATGPNGNLLVRAFEDSNRNGTQDGGEAPLPNLHLTITSVSAPANQTGIKVGDSEQSVVNSLVQGNTTTNDLGQLSVLSLGAGSYRVAADRLAGFDPTTPTDQTVTVNDGRTTDVNFGNLRLQTPSPGEPGGGTPGGGTPGGGTPGGGTNGGTAGPGGQGGLVGAAQDAFGNLPTTGQAGVIAFLIFLILSGGYYGIRYWRNRKGTNA